MRAVKLKYGVLLHVNGDKKHSNVTVSVECCRLSERDPTQHNHETQHDRGSNPKPVGGRTWSTVILAAFIHEWFPCMKDVLSILLFSFITGHITEKNIILDSFRRKWPTSPKVLPHYWCLCSCCTHSGWLLPVCTDSSTDTVANPSSIWPRLIALLGLVLQRLRVTVAGVYRQLHRHCTEPLESMASVDCLVRFRARKTVHIYGRIRDDAEVQARLVWTHLKQPNTPSQQRKWTTHTTLPQAFYFI
jgi:hypothetical protein